MSDTTTSAAATPPVATGVERGVDALRRGDWLAARKAFESVLASNDGASMDRPVAAATDGLGRALWWLGDAESSRMMRQRAYAEYRKAGDLRAAARIALWLAGEYGSVWANESAANGWLARAERLLRDVAAGAEAGWLALARAERAPKPDTAVRHAQEALDRAFEFEDVDLELRSLAALGFAEVSLGRVEEGLARFDEAMAGGTGGEPSDLATLADLYCALLAACELAGDEDRPKQWGQVIETFVRDHGHIPLLSFCRCCCADMFAANGRFDEAERELTTALQELTAAGQRARCVHPAARLAERRVSQGRFEEAEALLSGFERSPEAVHAAVALRLARGEHRAAAELLQRRLDEVGRDTLLAVPLLGQLVEALLAMGDVAAAEAAAEQIRALAARSGNRRVHATAALAAGRAAIAAGDRRRGHAALNEAIAGFAEARLRLDAARARLELARATAPDSAEVAADLARGARAEFEQLDATRDADIASAVLRQLGVRGRAGPRAHGVLSKREMGVLRLLGEGLSNAEIAARLFISPKTAEHHVGRILSKLGLRSRGEAGAHALRHLQDSESE